MELRTILISIILVVAAACAVNPGNSDSPDPTAAPVLSGDEHVTPSTQPAETAGSASGEAQDEPEEVRVVTVGGGVTEIVAALGFGEAIVAVDRTSTYPPHVRELPQIGFARSLSAEGILAQRPTLVIGTEDDGPPPVMEQLEALGIQHIAAPDVTTIEAAYTRVRVVAQALDRVEQGEAMVEGIEETLSRVQEQWRPDEERPRALLVYARGHGTLLVGGRETVAEALLLAAGATMAVEAFEGFQPLTAEAVIAARPDVIVIPARGLESLGGAEGLLAVPGVAQTPAGEAQAFIAIDDALALSFGPRLGEAVQTLADRLKEVGG